MGFEGNLPWKDHRSSNNSMEHGTLVPFISCAVYHSECWQLFNLLPSNNGKTWLRWTVLISTAATTNAKKPWTSWPYRWLANPTKWRRKLWASWTSSADSFAKGEATPQENSSADRNWPVLTVSATLQVGQTPHWPQAFHFLSFSHSFPFSRVDRILTSGRQGDFDQPFNWNSSKSSDDQWFQSPRPPLLVKTKNQKTYIDLHSTVCFQFQNF